MDGSIPGIYGGGPDQSRYVELFHNRTGTGSDLLAADLNKDGLVDIITSSNRGTFIFWNQGNKKQSAKTNGN